MRKKILIFGPIADFGGRELESAFIAEALSASYDVEVCSISAFTKKSQVFHFNKRLKVFSLNDLIYKKFFTIRASSLISFFKNQHSKKLSDYANNKFAKNRLAYDDKRAMVLDSLIKNYDLIFICAQVSSNHVGEIVRISKEKSKKVIFRTTGAIDDYPYEYAQEVDCYIHHSMKNAQNLNTPKHHFEIIDQCAYNETELLKIPLVNKKATTFLTIARLVKDKNIDVIIEAFKKAKSVGNKLYVIGTGPELENLKALAAGDSDIIFTGFIPNQEITAFFSKVDGIIISHYEFETGPLTGIEAMAAGRLIISAKTGAMSERLPFHQFWFENSVEDLAHQISELKKLEPNEILSLSETIRNRYSENYAFKHIAGRYLDVVKKVLDSCG